MGVMQAVIAQFKRPTGVAGRLVGWIMAHRASNRARNRWTVELLVLQPHHHVLEIGYGPGLAIAEVASRVPQGIVYGVDHSEVMRQQAAARNQSYVAQGRVKLSLGSAEDLSGTDGPYDRIYSVNVAQFWSDRRAVLARLLQRLAPQGLLVTTYQPRGKRATDADAEQFASKLADDLRSVGYCDVEIVRGPKVGILTVAVRGRRP